MRITKKTEITIETARLVFISGQRRYKRAKCELCDSLVAMVTVDEAATIAQVSSRALYRLIEDGELHFIEAPNGPLLVCLNSISPVAQVFRKSERPPRQ